MTSCESQTSSLLALPLELRMTMYEALFAPIHHGLSMQSVIALPQIVGVCRQICFESVPLLRQIVASHSGVLERTVQAHDLSMKAACDLSAYAGNAIKAGRYRVELRKFNVFLQHLDRINATVMWIH